ncbi:M50 family metallopeptidase [Phenylobacterium montanum]|uniref:M50 family metallopeptidase n=1 Tax=Phenylobacterium montanum TaxID=2823693 RepID=UPI00345FB1EE
MTWLPVISLIITVHELGHFWMARAFGIAVERFSLGFGRAIVSWRDKAGIEWRIGWIPMGGYVRFAGDDNAASVPDETDLKALKAEIIATEGPGAELRYFAFKPVWQRALVAAAGPCANFILAIAIFAVLLGSLGEYVTMPKVDQVVPGSAAERAGFKAGDLILQANAHRIDSFEDLASYVMVRGDAPIAFTVERGGQRLQLTATPAERLETKGINAGRHVGSLGVVAPHSRDAYRHLTYGPAAAVAGGVHETWDIVSTTSYYIGRLVTGQVSADQLGGPLRTAQLSGAVATAAAHSERDLPTKAFAVLVGLAQLAAFISVSIGFVNLLPIPVLDGGHLVFYAYEAVARRPLAEPVQTASYRVGLALLLGLMLFATTNDLHHSSVFQFLGGLFS